MTEEELLSRVTAKLAEELVENLHLPELMRLETAARYPDRSSKVVRRLVQEGIIPITAFTGTPQIRKQDLDALIKNGECHCNRCSQKKLLTN